MSRRNIWAEQAKELLTDNVKRADRATRELFFLYDEAAFKVESDINAMYARFARDNKLTLAEANRLLTGSEYSVWKKSIDKYLDNVPGGAEGSKALLELNTLAMKSRISRQEQLLTNIYRNMLDLAGDATTDLTTLLEDIVRVNYYQGGYYLQKGAGIGFRIPKINEKMVKDLIAYPWQTKHFSKSLWEKTDTLAALCKREITYGFINGSSVQKIAKEINDVMGKGKYAAERLVRTECKYFANQGELEGYKANDIGRYRFIGGTEGSHACECAALNGETFHVEDAEAGVNYPPLHPNCLCIVVADFDRSMFRNRKDAVPLKDNIKFQEWQRQFVG